MTRAATLTERRALPNGVRLAVRHRPGADVTTVSVWLLRGSRHERVPGVAHLFEHVVMQGIPAGRRLRVVDEIEACGGDANAVTTRDHVILYARVPTADAAHALAVLVAAATSGAFDADLVAAEGRVAQEELRLAAADPTDVVHDVFFRTAFGDHPMGRPVGGTPDGIARLDAAALAAWAGELGPGLVAVAASGGLPPDEIERVVAAGPLAELSSPDSAPDVPGAPPGLRPGRADLTMVADTAAIVLGGPAYPLGDDRSAAAEVVVELLAGGNAAVLTDEIRSRRGLSYDVSGDLTGYADTGVWRVSISTAPDRCAEVVDLATRLVGEAVQRGWTAEQVALARRRVAGLLRLDAESSLDETVLLGQHRFVGGVADWSVAGYAGQVLAVDAAAVHACARAMTDRLVVATAGGEPA